MVVDNLKIDTNKRQVYKTDGRIPLTGVEYSLVELLMSYPGKSFTRGEILQQVWGYGAEQYADTRVVDVHISRLRLKLEDDPENPEYILTLGEVVTFFNELLN
jgi:OmpR family response regulator RpaB